MDKKRITEIRGDETATYEVLLDKEYTVKTFVDEVLKDKYEWGDVVLDNNSNTLICQYRKGIRLKRIPDEYKDKKVISATSDGGWSLMEYKLKIEK